MPYIERIKQIKKERGLSNQELSTMTGIPVSTVTKFLNGSTGEPPFSTYVKFAQALGFSLDEIAGITRPNETKAEAIAENTIEAYTLLIAEKNARIQDKENEVAKLQEKNAKMQITCRHILLGCAALVSVILLVVVFDLVNGNIGFVRY